MFDLFGYDLFCLEYDLFLPWSFLISLMLLVPIVKRESSGEQNDVSLKQSKISEQTSDTQRYLASDWLRTNA